MKKQYVLFAVKASPHDAALRRFVAEEIRIIERIIADKGKVPFPGLVRRSMKLFGFDIFHDPIPLAYAQDYLDNQYMLLEVEVDTQKISNVWKPPVLH